MGTPNGGINGTLATGLLGHWSFDNGSLLDESGNGRDFIKIGNPVSSIDKDNIPNNAYDDMDYNNLLYYYDENLRLANSSITVSLWTDNKNDIGIYHDLFITNELNPNDHQYGFLITRLGNSILYGTLGNFISEIVPTGWYNITVSYDFATDIWKCYINGEYKSQHEATIQSLPRFWQIGGGYNNDGVSAKIDEVRIYNRVLTDSEVAEIYTMGVNYETLRPSPSVSVDSGTYIGSVTIEMSTEEGDIYYTLNGADPDESDMLYENPITISRSVVLKAVSISNGVSSEILTRIYYIEGGDIGMEENQSAGLIVIGWTPEGETKETILGEVPADGQEVLSIQETINYFKTKYAGEYPTEGRVVAGAATFTVDLIESQTLRGLLSNTSVVSGTKIIIGMNSGAKAKTGKLRLHPMYAGADKSEDIVILRAAPAVTDERTYSADGKKLMKVVFTVMGVKTALDTPTTGNFTAHVNGSGIKVKMANANDLGVSVASATGNAVNDSTNIVNFTTGVGANRAIFFKSSDNFATAANTSYYEPTVAEIKAGSFAPETVTWKTLTSLTEIPTEATGYYYKAIEIGV